MVTVEIDQPKVLTAYDRALAKAQRDVATLDLICQRNNRDPEKRVRLAYRQFHQAALSGSEADFMAVKQTIADTIRDFGPKEDICLLKANLNGRFHCLAQVKQELQICPALAGRPEGRSILADVDFQEGRYEQARIAFENLIAENRTWDNLARLAHWHGKLGQADTADRLYAEAGEELTAKEMRSFAWLELQRGDLALSRGRIALARRHYECAAASFPGHWLTDSHLAGVLAAEKRFAEAGELLRSVLTRAPKPEFKQALGELLDYLGQTEEARSWLAAAESAFLDSVQAGGVHYYHHLADLYADAANRAPEAIVWARKDVALRSNFSTQAALAWALFQNGEVAEGLDWIALALSSGVQDGGIFATASSLYRAAGETGQADSYASAAARINPHGSEFHLHV